MDPIEAVRLYIADKDPEQWVLDNPTIESFLLLNAGNTLMAAADALDAIAVSETLVGKYIKTQDLSTDGAKVAESLRKSADRLRARAKDQDPSSDFFEVASFSSHRRPEHTGRSSEVWGL